MTTEPGPKVSDKVTAELVDCIPEPEPSPDPLPVPQTDVTRAPPPEQE